MKRYGLRSIIILISIQWISIQSFAQKSDCDEDDCLLAPIPELCISYCNSFASEGIRKKTPHWLFRTPISTSGNYTYVVGKGETRSESYANALDMIARRKNGLLASNDLRSESLNVLRQINFDRSLSFQSESGKNIYASVVAQYFDGVNFYSLLGASDIQEGAGLIDQKKFIRRSTIFPGWGQLYNKETIKGASIMTGEILLISSSIYSFNRSKADANNQGSWRLKGTLLGAGAAVLWVLNVIDASKSQKNLYAMNEESKLEFIVTTNGFGIGYHLNSL